MLTDDLLRNLALVQIVVSLQIEVGHLARQVFTLVLLRPGALQLLA